MDGDSPMTMMMRKSKKPKIEDVADDASADAVATAARDDADGGEVSLQEQEEALVALIESRSKDVETLHRKAAHYQAVLQEAEKGLTTLHSKLAALRSRSSKPQVTEASNHNANGIRTVKQEKRSPSPVAVRISPIQMQTQSKPQLVIPALKPKGTVSASNDVKVKQPIKPVSGGCRATPPPKPSESVSIQCGSAEKSKNGNVSPENMKRKRPRVHKESQDVVPSVQSRSSPSLIHVQMSTHISSQHTRRLRCLAINPSDDQQFFTSALDGVLNLWQIRANGSAASLQRTIQCSSLKGRWPEDVVWHPYGDDLFAVYTADGGDSQVSIINLNAPPENRVTFLQEKPHVKGIINNIQFMPWADLMFVTGGSDHAVIQWHKKENGSSWKPQSVHRNQHSSSVTGVAGLQHKKVVLSVGADKRIVGYDLASSRSDYKHQLDSKCMSVMTNPLDFNLFVVQTGSPETQLRLFDIRLRQTEIHAFGWKQESSESQSALINPAWSPDGFYLSSGSADPMIHIFDIRYSGSGPSQSIPAHQKRVFKAAWHQRHPLLLSISSDLNIGLHTIT